MSSDVEIRNEVVNAVRSVLTLSKDGFFFSDFVREYRTQMGENVPYQRLVSRMTSRENKPTN